MNDHDLVLAIQELLDGVEWTTETPDQIACLLIEAGYRVRNLQDEDNYPSRPGSPEDWGAW